MGSSKYFGLQGNALSRLQTALIVAPSFILFGYNQAGIGGLITEDDWVKTFPQIDTVHATAAERSGRSTLQGFVVAVFVVGALFGSLSCSYTGDRFGRRNVIFVAGICTLIGEILEASAFGLPQFIVGRVIVGLGVGQLSSLVPVWQSETSGAKNRGRHVVLDGLFICLGYVLESWIDLGFFEFGSGPRTWRPPVAIACVFSLVLVAAVYAFPESPRWLLMMGKNVQARENLAVLRGLPQDSHEVMAEIEGIELSLEITADGGAKLSHLLKMGEDKLAYRFGLCILLQFYQQMSGSNLISVYAPILFQENLGLSSEVSRVLSGGALTWKFLSSFLAFAAIDRFGRRAVFMVSGAGMSCCMIALAVATSFPTTNRSSQIAAGCFIYLYNTFVPIGFLGANFLYCTEVAPLRLRMSMSSISTANHWAWNFLVAMVTPVAIYDIGWRYYIVFAAVAACVPVSVYFLFPETMGRNLEEIDLMFKQSPSAWATVKFEKSRRKGMPQDFEDKEDGGAVGPEHEEG
ncbi:general substrate transporter [Hypoxylon crocopeplum]|nr:general substrate transporter [Hypoxylon crocopeplum]